VYARVIAYMIRLRLDLRAENFSPRHCALVEHPINLLAVKWSVRLAIILLCFYSEVGGPWKYAVSFPHLHLCDRRGHNEFVSARMRCNHCASFCTRAVHKKGEANFSLLLLLCGREKEKNEKNNDSRARVAEMCHADGRRRVFWSLTTNVRTAVAN